MRTTVLQQADLIAEEVLERLYPHCLKLQIVGSIRRRSPMIGDIDIACVPNPGSYEGKVSHGFAEAVNSFEKVKGDPAGRFARRLMENGTSVDFFISTLDTFGAMMAFRTGSANFYKRVIAAQIEHLKLKVIHGALFDQYDRFIPTYEEQEFFDVINLPWRGPELRAF